MEFTGERAIPGQTDPDLMNEHWERYAFAEALVGSKRVLDAGCGVGYGAARLAEVAAEVVALDQARDPLTAGSKQYSHPRLRFVQGDCTRFPFADSSLDAVVAFEVIEHLDEWKALIEESRRVLVPAGQFIVSTPNRLYYGEAREDPNPFHVHEFTPRRVPRGIGAVLPARDAVSREPRGRVGVRERVPGHSRASRDRRPGPGRSTLLSGGLLTAAAARLASLRLFAFLGQPSPRAREAHRPIARGGQQAGRMAGSGAG